MTGTTRAQKWRAGSKTLESRASVSDYPRSTRIVQDADSVPPQWLPLGYKNFKEKEGAKIWAELTEVKGSQQPWRMDHRRLRLVMHRRRRGSAGQQDDRESAPENEG